MMLLGASGFGGCCREGSFGWVSSFFVGSVVTIGGLIGISMADLGGVWATC